MYFFIGLGTLFPQLSDAQIRSTSGIRYSTLAEDSAIINRQSDSLVYYKSLYEANPEELPVLNQYLEFLARNYRFEELDQYVDQHKESYKGWGDGYEQTRFLLAWAHSAQYNTLFDSAEQILLELANDTLYQRWPKQVAKTQYKLGIVHRLKGEYYLATRYLNEARTYFEVTADSLQYHETEVQLGILALLERDSVKPIEAFDRMIRYAESVQDSTHLSLAYSLKSIYMQNYNRFEEGAVLAQKSLEIRYQQKDIANQAESLNNLAINMMGQKKMFLARQLLDEALRKFKLSNNLVFVPTLLNNMGRMEEESGNFQLSRTLFQEALQIAQKRNQRHDMKVAYRRLARLCREEGDYEGAYRALAKYVRLHSRILGEDKLRKIADLEARYEDEENERELRFLKKEQTYIQSRNLALIVGLVGLLLAAVSLIFFNRKRAQQAKKILEGQEAHAQQALVIANQKLELAKQRLDGFVERMVEKTHLVEELENRVQDLEELVEVKDQKRVEFESQLLKIKILTQDDWGQFRNLFNEVYPGFLDRLTTSYPELSKGELRILVLTYLELTIQESAAMLGISVSAIKKARYRLRKKIGIAENVDLKTFIKGF